jgi:hypothetical protein
LKKRTEGGASLTFSRFEANLGGMMRVDKTNPMAWPGPGTKEVFEKTNPLGAVPPEGVGDLKKRTQVREAAGFLQFEANLDGGVACVSWEIEKTNPNWGRVDSLRLTS